MLITIDGGPAQGKSTMARLVAGRYGLRFLSSGSLYRLATFLHLSVLAPSDRSAMVPTTGSQAFSLLAQHEDRLRDPSITEQVTKIASDPCVRHAVNRLIRGIASEEDLVVDGRDMALVLPDADRKFIFRSSLDERRRVLQEQGTEPFEDLMDRESREVPIAVDNADCIVLNPLAQPLAETLAIVCSHIDPLVVRGWTAWSIDYCGPFETVGVTPPIAGDLRAGEGEMLTLIRSEAVSDPHEAGRIAETFRPTVLTGAGIAQLASMARGRVRVVATSGECLIYRTRRAEVELTATVDLPSSAVLCSDRRGMAYLSAHGVRTIALRGESLGVHGAAATSEESIELLGLASREFEEVLFRLSDIPAFGRTRNPDLAVRGAARLLITSEVLNAELDLISSVNRAKGNIGALLPYVRTSREALDSAEAVRQRFTGRLGVMLEVPLAIYEFASFSRLFDFFVIGMRDLGQLLVGRETGVGVQSEGEEFATHLVLQHVLPKLTRSQTLYTTSRAMFGSLRRAEGFKSITYLHKAGFSAGGE